MGDRNDTRPAGSQTTVQTNQLPSFVEGPLKTAAGRAETLFDKGIGGTPYPGSTYVPPVAEELEGINQIRLMAMGAPPGSRIVPSASGKAQVVETPSGIRTNVNRYQGTNFGPVQPAAEQLTGLLGNQGITGDHRSALEPAQRIAQGDIHINTGGDFGNLADQFGQRSFAERNLGGMGRGSQSLGRRFDPAFGNLYGQMGGRTAADRFTGGIAGGQQVAGAQGLQGLLGGIGNPMASERFLEDAASGQFLGADGNPHFNEALQTASDRAMDAITSRMASMGRLGSPGAHTGTAAREIGELQTRARADQHNLERQLQQQAAAQMDQARQARQAQQLQGTGMLSDIDLSRRGQMMQAAGLQDQSRMAQGGLLSGILGQRAGLMGQDLSNRMAATGQMDQARLAGLQGRMGALQGQTGVEAANIANQGQTALSLGDQFGAGRDAMMRGMALSPALRQAQFQDPRQLINVGAGLRGELQDELQSNIQRFQGEQNAPWARLGLLTSALQGFPNMGTVTKQTTGTVPRGSPIAGALGGGMLGLGAAGPLATAGTIGLPGVGLLGGLGALGGAFM